MRFFYCTICNHYHIDDAILPCSTLGKQSKQAVLSLDKGFCAEIKKCSQSMLTKAFLQTLNAKGMRIKADLLIGARKRRNKY